MRYESLELRRRLAAEYTLGTMPSLARRRFERLMAEDPALARLVGEWADRLAPLDDVAPTAEPPSRVWRAIERRIADGMGTAPASSPGWFGSLAFWRGLALAAATAAAGLFIYVAAFSGRAPVPHVLAVLSGRGGVPGWVAVTGPKPGEVSFSAVTPAREPKPQAFELWSITAGAPRPLGLLPQNPGTAVTFSLAQLPAPGGVLAVSLEPPGGSPTGLPTGPVLYQGKVLVRSP
jgi:anti-sigma-K factor RskA